MEIKRLKGDLKHHEYATRMTRFDSARQESQDHVTEARMWNHFNKFVKERDPTRITNFIARGQRQDEGAADALARRSVQLPGGSRSPSRVSPSGSPSHSFSDDLSVPPARRKQSPRTAYSIPVLSQQYELVPPQQQ